MSVRGALLVFVAVTAAVAQSVDSEQHGQPTPTFTNKTHTPSHCGTLRQPSRPRVRFDVSLIGHRRVDHGMNLYSQRDEQSLGNKLSTLVEKNALVINDPLVTQYIHRLEKLISSNSDTRYPVRIKVVKDVEGNAYSLPGGFIYVQGGLILAAENEAQLMAALSHETAHIAGRHFTKLVTQQKVWKWSSLVAAGPAGYLIGRKLSPLFLARSLRRSELDADLLGLQYEYASGYDPAEFVNLIKNLSDDDEKPSLVDRLSDSHPPAGLRISRAQHFMENYLPARAEMVVDTSDFQEFKARVIALMGWGE